MTEKLSVSEFHFFFILRKIIYEFWDILDRVYLVIK